MHWRAGSPKEPKNNMSTKKQTTDTARLVEQVRIREALGLLMDNPTLTVRLTMTPVQWVELASRAKRCNVTIEEALVEMATGNPAWGPE